MSDSLQPHGLHSPWNSPGQNTGVGSLSLLQGIFPTQGSNPGLLHCRQILYQLNHKGNLDLHKERNNIRAWITNGKKKKFMFLFLIDLTDNCCKVIIPTMYVIVYACDACTYICINIYIYIYICLCVSEMNIAVILCPGGKNYTFLKAHRMYNTKSDPYVNDGLVGWVSM